MDKSRLLLLQGPVCLMIAFLLGILLGNFWMEQEFGKLMVLVVVALLVLLRLGYGEASGFKFFVFVSIAVFLGFLRFFYSFELSANHVVNFLGESMLSGCIVSEPDVRDDKVKYTVTVLEIGDGQNVSGKVLIYGDRYPVYNYGDCLLVSGFLQRPDLIEDFDYEKYLTRYGIYAVMYRAKVEKIETMDSGRGSERGGMRNLFFESIYNFKSDVDERLRRIFAEPYSSFLAGLLLGSRRGIPLELTEDFNTTGLSHIVAISGYNITLVILAVGFVFNFLSRRKKVFMSVLFIVVFVVMVGMSAAVVRSAIMGIIGLLAIWFGRQYMVTVALIASAFFMNLWNPKILIYDIGFQLSFMATAGIIYFRPLLEKYFIKWPGFLGIKETLLMTLSAQVLATPIILLNFQRFSLIAPLANIFVLPFIPFVMLTGFAAILCSYFFGFFAGIFGFITYLLLKLMIFFVEFFADIPLASLDIGWFGWLPAAVYYWIAWRLLT